MFLLGRILSQYDENNSCHIACHISELRLQQYHSHVHHNIVRMKSLLLVQYFELAVPSIQILLFQAPSTLIREHCGYTVRKIIPVQYRFRKQVSWIR